MLTKKISLYCCESPTLIENYNDAKEDNTHTWRLHHRFEVNEFGGLSRNELISLGLWLKRPASELIFLSKEDHTKLHKSQKKRSGRANIVIAIKFLLALGFEMKNITLKDIDEMLKKLRKLSILYKQMKANCHSPNAQVYKFYGARGIKVCDEWLNDSDSFRLWALKNGYTLNPKSRGTKLLRKDKGGNYSPENCEIVND